MNALIRLAIRRPIGTIMIFLGLMVVAWVSFQRLRIDLFPDIDFPALSIVTSYEGVGPEEIETLITRPVEQALSTIQGVESIESTCSEGSSNVQLRFAWGTNLDTAVNDVRAALDRLSNRLPEDADRPVVYKFDISAMPVAVIGLSGAGDPRRLRILAEETLAPRLEHVNGVAAVSVRGGQIREIQVELDASRLLAHGISAQQVVSALGRDNQNVSVGQMLDTGREVLVRTVGEWSSPEDVENVLVAVQQGQPLYIRDLAQVRDTFEETTNLLWIDGAQGISMGISKESGANTVEVVDALVEEIARINEDYAGRANLTVRRESASFIRNSVTNVQSSALRGAILAIFVLLFFLHNVRSTLIIATAIPTSILATFLLMYLVGFTLNTVTFGGLALGVGMLIDSAIVVLENIQRKRNEGLQPIEAALEGTREVASAITASTLTTVVIFAPVIFIQGFAGIFFGQMAVVVTFALMCSLLVSLTLVPTLAARIPANTNPSKRSPGARASRLIERAFGRLVRGYGVAIAWALRAPGFVILCGVLLLVASLRLASSVGFELMPETDEGRLDIDVELPVGTPIDQTAQVMQEATRLAMASLEEGELVNTVTSAGSRGRWGSGTPNVGSIQLNLVKVTERERSVDTIMAGVRQALMRLPGAQVRVRKSSQDFLARIIRGGTSERLTVEVRGHDLATSARLSRQVVEAMQSIEGVADARTEQENGMRERDVLIDTERAADLGLSRSEIAEVLETYVLGRVATRLREFGNEYNVRVQLREEDRRHVDQLESLPILTPSGAFVPLSTVARIVQTDGPLTITRIGQERVSRVFGGLTTGDLRGVNADLQEALRQIDVPDGFTVSIAGEQAEQQKTFGGMLIGVILAIFLVYLVMAVQYESVRHPLIIMGSVPFAAIGVVATLVLTGTTFNINSFMGVFILVGIVVNNAIVLVDYINLMRREHGMPLREAVIESARRRLRPILMTTLTTVLGLLPLAMGLGEGSEIQAPLARVVVGGLSSSALITLVLVPCFYYLWERRLERRRATAGPSMG